MLANFIKDGTFFDEIIKFLFISLDISFCFFHDEIKDNIVQIAIILNAVNSFLIGESILTSGSGEPLGTKL